MMFVLLNFKAKHSILNGMKWKANTWMSEVGFDKNNLLKYWLEWWSWKWKTTAMTWKYKGMKTWKPWCVWWTLRNKQNEVNSVWMLSWKFVVMWMLQVVYRMHYVLWCCLVCLQHYFVCIHQIIVWEMLSEKERKERKLSFNFNFNNFPPFLSLSFNDFYPHDFSFPFQLFQPTSALSLTFPQLLAKNKFQREIIVWLSTPPDELKSPVFCPFTNKMDCIDSQLRFSNFCSSLPSELVSLSLQYNYHYIHHK